MAQMYTESSGFGRRVLYGANLYKLIGDKRVFLVAVSSMRGIT